ncbi:hypothetical protein [Amycolatopsis australiensis]|uniref:Uncharacterized protein n=1 Tax=Amycolatopsis australiensis TaxID=546364 RepID=A0A1K1LQ26_9PSEU|nr:hypothetical protein [Amycolatopsis australiensis]SFW12980.1 hypothetical protein SAMN04489730_0127 [Amycolatopsis australiensis]
MTQNAGSKRRRRVKAREGNEFYVRAQSGRTGSRRDVDGASAVSAELSLLLDEAEQAYRQDDDPYLKQAGFSAASRLYEQLAGGTDDPTWKHAARMAGLMFSVLGARTRWAHGIPTITPRAEAELLGLGACEGCGRPWQVDDAAELCEQCPRLRFGPTPQSADEAVRLGSGEPVSLRELVVRNDADQ